MSKGTCSALSVKYRPWIAPHRRRYYQLRDMSPPVDFRVHNSSIVNLVRGLVTRVFLYKGVTPTQPLRNIYERRLSYFRRLLVRGFNSTTPISRQEFVGYYRGRKATIYQKAVDDLVNRAISPTDAHIKAFVKAERINFSDKHDPDPRIIQPRDPRYNVEVGRYLRPIEDRLYHQVAVVFGEDTIFKGYNSQQMAAKFVEKWSRYTKPCGIGLDASRFDQHVSVDALKWEHSIYNRIYNSKELKRLLRWQLVNYGRGYTRDGSVKYQVDGRRMSGDMNTGMGNCLLMCAMVHCYAFEKGIKISLANNGDDCMVVMESSDAHSFTSDLSQWFTEMGFVMKVEKPVYDLERVEFCQTHPINVDGTWLMVRKCATAIAKDCISLQQIVSPYMLRAYLSAVGLGGLSLSGGVPIFQSFYCSLIRSAERLHHRRRRRKAPVQASYCLDGGLAWLSKGMCRKKSPISQETRYSFWLAFGITPDMQVAIERYYDNAQIWYAPVLDGAHLPDWFSC